MNAQWWFTVGMAEFEVDEDCADQVNQKIDILLNGENDEQYYQVGAGNGEGSGGNGRSVERQQQSIL